MEVARLIFVDALDDFCRVDKIVARFIYWLSIDEPSFTEAYIQLFIPKLISPFIRLELLDWNPLEVDGRPLSSMKWYEELLSCTAENTSVECEHPLIVSLIPLCVEKIVLPKLAGIIREQWDPLSSEQCKRLGCLINTMIDECPTLVASSRSVQQVLEALRERVQESIDEDLFMPIYSKQAVENAATGCRAFLDRQFWTAIKLMRCLGYFSDILSKECICQLMLEGIAGRCLVLALQCSVTDDTSIIRKCDAILKLIPSENWAQYSSGPLRSLSSVLLRIADENISKEKELSRRIRRVVTGD